MGSRRLWVEVIVEAQFWCECYGRGAFGDISCSFWHGGWGDGREAEASVPAFGVVPAVEAVETGGFEGFAAFDDGDEIGG